MKKIINITVMVFILILIIQSYVQAASFNFEVLPSRTEVEPGDTIELTFSIASIDIGTSGMNTIEAVLDYDTSIFEEITINNIEGLNDWIFKYNKDNKKMLGYVFSSGINTKQDIINIIFKVKTNAQVCDTNININNITTNDGTNLIKTENISQGIKIIKQESKNYNQNNNSSSSTNVNEKDTTVANKAIPQTGQRVVLISTMTMISMAIAIFTQIKLRKK